MRMSLEQQAPDRGRAVRGRTASAGTPLNNFAHKKSGGVPRTGQQQYPPRKVLSCCPLGYPVWWWACVLRRWRVVRMTIQVAQPGLAARARAAPTVAPAAPSGPEGRAPGAPVEPPRAGAAAARSP